MAAHCLKNGTQRSRVKVPAGAKVELQLDEFLCYIFVVPVLTAVSFPAMNYLYTVKSLKTARLLGVTRNLW